MVPFEVREGMEGKHIRETNLTRHRQVLEKGDKFESSFLILDSCCFLALLREDTYLLRALWNGSEVAFSRICLPAGEWKLF